MYDRSECYATLSEAYLAALDNVLNHPQYVCSPRGLKIHEITDYSFSVRNPTSEPIVTNDSERNLVIVSYTAKEKQLYDSCSNRVEDFAKASKFWEKIANPDGTVNSAYGKLIWKDKSLGNPEYEWELKGVPNLLDPSGKPIETRFSKWRTPWEWCLEALRTDKDTRQAVLKFSRQDHHWMGNKDFTCTISGNFLIRNDYLNFSVVMRSNDLVKGTSFDCPWFISLMERMVEELKPTYPELKVGTYSHFAHSLHVYERDFETVRKMIGKV